MQPCVMSCVCHSNLIRIFPDSPIHQMPLILDNYSFHNYDPIMFIFLPFSSGFTFYKMTNLDNRIANADQLLTQVSLVICKCKVLYCALNFWSFLMLFYTSEEIINFSVVVRLCSCFCCNNMQCL